MALAFLIDPRTLFLLQYLQKKEGKKEKRSDYKVQFFLISCIAEYLHVRSTHIHGDLYQI